MLIVIMGCSGKGLTINLLQLIHRAVIVLLLFPALLAEAQVSSSKKDREPANYAFANYLGTGIYSTSGQDVTIINLPMTYQPKKQGELIYRFRLPVSLGFYDFDFDTDEVGENVPDSVDTFTFVPGVEVDVPINDQLTLVPYIDLGWSRNFTTNENVIIYSIGLSSIYDFRALGEKHLWVNRLIWAGYETQSSDVTDSFASIQTGLDWRTPWRWGKRGSGSFTTVYGITHWYFSEVDFRRPDQESDDSVTMSYELGFSFGFDKGLDFSLFTLDRVALGYRWSDDLKIWRITFNLPI